MAEESKIEQNFNAPVSGVAGVVQGDQIINPPQTPQAEKPAEAKAAYQLALEKAGDNAQILQIKLDDLAHVTAV